MIGEKASVAFVFALLQDVNILWPVARLAGEETSYPLLFLVSDKFLERDTGGRWLAELRKLQAATGADLHIFSSTMAARELLADRRGIIFSASETSLNPHRVAHDLFRGLPATFTRVTLQHGYECAGFYHNREQSLAFGEQVDFAADVLGSWMGRERLRDMRSVDLAKVLVTGLSAKIVVERSLADPALPAGTGLVCENLHSVRMSAVGDFKQSYMDTFGGFATVMAHRGRTVALRPHPGGQYVLKERLELPEGVVLQNDPMYRTDLSRFAYGISAPSSVLVDMILAGIPTAVWQDPDGAMDTSSYAGLAKVSDLAEWIAFADAAIAEPELFLEAQRQWLEKSGLVTDAPLVRSRFLSLIRGACGSGAGARPKAQSKRVLFVANGLIPTLEICFLKPLAPLAEQGILDLMVVTEGQVRKAMGPARTNESGAAWLDSLLDQHQPQIVVLCRYSGPLAQAFVEQCRRRDIPIVYHVDDDLMNVPREIGPEKFREHNSPERLLSVSTFLSRADLVYCSTEPLLQRIRQLGYGSHLVTGHGHCSGTIYRRPVERPVRTIGYMGFDHSHDLQLLLDDLVRLLRDRPEVRFELFGTIPVPDELLEFGDRITSVLPVRPYQAFVDKLVALDWCVGIAPLADTSFNRYKANNKWIEYTSAGYAVVATAGMAYDHCCADECGILVEGGRGWYEALSLLCDDADMRARIVRNAQDRLISEYSVDRLRKQVLEVFDQAAGLAAQRGGQAAA